MEAEKIIKTGQEQAVASWISYLNQIRVERLQEAINQILETEGENLADAQASINEALKKITEDIVNKGQGRGGLNGMHGFIAEISEVGIGNARELIEGKAPIYEWINDNSPDDLRRGAVYIQQKFCAAGNHLSLEAIKMHHDKYPDYLDGMRKYQIPADHYEKIKWLLSISKEDANKMATGTGEFSLKQWKEVHEFFESGDIPLDRIEPSLLEYKDVQRGMYETTYENEQIRLQERNEERIQEQKDSAYNESKPTLKEGAKATVIAAAIEGGMTLCMDIAKKRKEGKRICEFDENDWKEIVGDTGKSTLKGGVRGASIYALTNYTATPGAVASAMVTAGFGIAEQAHLFRKGQLTEQSFIENSEMLCLDASVSALSSFVGQALIPVPILGAVIGNTVGTMIYQVTKDSLSAKEQALIEEYIQSIKDFNAQLDEQYLKYVNDINESMVLYYSLLEKAFDPDVSIAFDGSIDLAKQIGVPAEEILDTKEKVMSFFMD